MKKEQDYFAEVRAIMAESRKKLDEELAEHRKAFAEELAEYRRETAERIVADRKANEERIAANEKSLAALNKMIGGVANSNGDYAEEYFYNAMSAKKTFANVQFDEVRTNMRYNDGIRGVGLDIVMLNGSAAAIIETKYKLQKEAVVELAAQKVDKFREMFPMYANYKIYLGVAAMAFGAGAEKRAKELGIGIIHQKGDSIECDTDNIKVY